MTLPAPEVWAGPECTWLEVGGWLCDQLALTGHDRRLDDVDRLAELGARAVRYPVLWGRTASRAEATDWAWAASRLERLRTLGIRPIVGLLHHGFGPAGLDPLDPAWPAAFGRYAAEVAGRLGVSSFLPVNEPLTTARFAGAYGWWPPYGRDHRTFVGLLLAQVEGFTQAARALRSRVGGATVVANEDLGRTFGSPACRAPAARDSARRWLTFDLMLGRVDRHHPLRAWLEVGRRERRILDRLCAEPEPPDVLGIDYYVTSDRYLDERLELFPAETRGGDGTLRYADVEVVRVAGHELPGFRSCIDEAWARYRTPIALTEVHLAGEPADQVAWWAEAVDAATAAVREGIPVLGVTAWSTFGAFEWGSVLRQPCGAYAAGCFDLRADGGLGLTRLGEAVRASARGRPVESARGWWRRPERVLYDARVDPRADTRAAA